MEIYCFLKSLHSLLRRLGKLSARSSDGACKFRSMWSVYTYLTFFLIASHWNNLIQFLLQVYSFVSTSRDCLIAFYQAGECSQSLFQSCAVFIFSFKRRDDSFDCTHFDQRIANRRRVLREWADKEHGLDDELLSISALYQTQEALKSTHLNESFHARLVTSHHTGDCMKSVTRDQWFIRHHLDKSR